MIFLFAKNPNAYSLAGYMQASMWFLYGIGSIFAEKYSAKHDPTNLCRLCSCMVVFVVVALPFTVMYNCVPVAIGLFAVMGFFYGPISSYQYQCLLAKTRILGISNEGLYARSLGYSFARIPGFVVGMFGILALPIAIWVCAGIHSVAVYSLPAIEESNRKLIVDYLQNNRMY